MLGSDDELLGNINSLRHKLASLNDDDNPELNRLIADLDNLQHDVVREKRRNTFVRLAKLVLVVLCVILLAAAVYAAVWHGLAN